MTPEHWQQINEALDGALELPPSERAAYLDAHCGDHATLRQKVATLVAAYEEAQSFLEEPLGQYAAPVMPAPGEDLLEGKRVGPYRLLLRIARGGMGTVYLAARDDQQYQKKVAVKLIRHGMDTEDVLRRFLAERQILARLEHPHIARLLDGGVTDDDRPYFVMEYVEGIPLDQYCDQHRLSIRDRLGLFLKACEAVRYAHQQLVVHRDLKPSNILVTPNGQVKLLDFGIAKLLSDEAEVPLTRTGLRVMTPEYAAPEQVKGEAITTATDVYALGVLLYTLLTGRLPYPVRGVSRQEIERAILDTEPTRPSTAITKVTTETGRQAEPPEVISRDRGTNLARLRRRLSGDLDTMVLKALRKEPARRYASVEAFEEDLHRHLAGLPVRARPDTLTYRASKFVRRHRVGVGATVMILALSVSYAVTANLQAERIGLERDKAQQVVTFLVDLFEVADPDHAKGDSLIVQDVLARGAARIDHELTDQPEVRAQMMSVIGEVYQKMGLYDEAHPLFEGALAVRRDVLGAAHPDVAASLDDRAWLRYLQGDRTAAEQELRQALTLRKALLGENHLDVAESMLNLGIVLREMGRYDDAEPLLREALAIRQRRLGDAHLAVAMAVKSLAELLYWKGDYDAAEPLYRQSLAQQRALLGNQHTDVADTEASLGLLLYNRGQYDEAERLTRKVLATYRILVGKDHPHVATCLNNLALILHVQGDFDAAEPVYREAVAVDRKALGEAHPQVVLGLNNLANLLIDKAAYDEAELLLYQALASWQQYHSGEDHPSVAAITENLGRALEKQQAYEAAEPFYRDALAIWKRLQGEKHPDIAISLYHLGRLLHAKGDQEEAETRYRQALTMTRELLGKTHPGVAAIINQLASLLKERGELAEAETLRLEHATTLQDELGVTHEQTQKALRGLVAFYEATGAQQKAEAYRALLAATDP